MKKLLFALPLLALAACEGSIASAISDTGKSSFSDGETIGTSDVNPGDFEGVSLAGPDNVVFTSGSEFSIRAEGDEEVVEQLRYKITNGQLKIGREKSGNWSIGKNSATVYVSAPSLKSAKLAGSGDMSVDEMDGEEAKVSIAGSGNITVSALKTASLSTKIAGSGNANLSGDADNVSISIAGSGDVKGKSLNADSATIKIAGSGDVALSSEGAVDAKIVGSGDIRVHGNATCTVKAAGSGKVTCS
ncbi:MAG: head GIN domain-containing protein [Parasphingorhabdus sp.]|uniref:head GIN domain-containing protein n=1 Tax=Parasphingorhabdus sp. TaxID=2709688 RepID=UPI003296AEA2